ncbi:MAG: basic amino acid/polyamine antiporter [Liquorilactobacillus nagelii]
MKAHIHNSSEKIGLITLVSIVITSALGSGIFTININLAKAAPAGSVIIGWMFVGFGTLMLALSINYLAVKMPELEGIFSYGQAGFGNFIGFFCGWGYWLSACLGNVAFAVILMSSFSFFFPVFQTGQNLTSIITASLILWGLIILVNHGVESAAILNTLITCCKLLPLLCLIGLGIENFNFSVFMSNLWQNSNSLIEKNNIDLIGKQVRGCMLTMAWVFVGIEGATTMAKRAKNKSDAGKATVLGMLCLLVLYVLASVLPYGYLSRAALSNLAQPSGAYIFKSMVGSWGGPFINLGIIISILGAWLSWTMLPAETTSLMAEKKLLPVVFNKKNKFGAPTFSLIIEGIMCQIFLLVIYFAADAYNLAYSLCTSSIIICYIFVGLFQIKTALKNKVSKEKYINLIIGLLTVFFEGAIIIFVGLKYLFLCFIAYLPGLLFYLWVKRKEAFVFSKFEVIEIGLLLLGSFYGLWIIYNL